MNPVNRTAVACVMIVCSLFLHGAEEAFHLPAVAAVVELKPLFPRTEIVRNGRGTACLVVPDRVSVRAAAEHFRAEIARRTGVGLPVVSDVELVDASWRVDPVRARGRTWIAFGNVNTNRLLAVLYGQRYVVADSIYPGESGYVVRTVHDPFATGVNVLVLAGSDDAGVARAVAVFLEKHAPSGADGSLVLPAPVVDVSFETKAYRFFPDVTDSLSSKRQPQHTGLDWFRERWTKAGFMDAEGHIVTHASKTVTRTALTGAISRMGQTYFRTGNPALPPMMKELLDKNRHLLQNADSVHGMGGRTSGHVHQWDLLEELPMWTRADRLAVTNALLADAALGNERRAFHKQVAEGMRQCLDENHGTFSALRSFQAWQYFDKYYPSDASRYWMRCADAVFDAQASTFQILEDAAGYLGYAPASTVNYALARGNLRYLDRGVALHHAISVARTCINNLGLSTGFGDSSNLVQPSFFEQLAPVAWYYRDPQLYWIVRNMLPQACGLRIFQNSIAFDLSVDPVRPDQWTGMSVLPIYEAPLAKGDARKVPVYADRTVVDPALFNKIVFRENWDEDGQYMLLDGAGVWGGPPGPHGHKQNDINTVVNLTAHGRMWLVDHSYQHRSYADHSSVMLMREGRGRYRKRTLARIRSLGENTKWGISGTSFMDNTRAIFWRKGKYFLVVDRCVASTDGEYMGRCSWRTLGEPTQGKTELLLEQQSRFFRIVSDGRASLDVEAVRLTNDQWSRFYPFAEPVVHVLQEDKRAVLKAGEVLGFANLLIPGATLAETKTVELRSPRESVVVVCDGDATVVAGIGVMPGADLAGGMFLFDSSTAFMGECTDAFGGVVLSDGPCDAMLDLGSGELRVRCVEGRVITLRGTVEAVLVNGKQVAFERRADDGVSVELAAGTSLVQLRGWSGLQSAAEFANAMRERIAKLPPAEEGATLGASADASEIPQIGVEEMDLGLPIADALAVDMDGDGTREWVAGGADGAGVFRADGTTVARFARDAEILSLDVGDVDGDGRPEIAVGTKDCKVRLYRADGSPLWEFACKPSKGATDAPPAVEMVKIADLDGDGRREIVAGANWVHVINADGSLRWERYMDLRRGRICGDFVCGEVTDLDGDGTREIVALFNTSYPLLKAYDHRGEVVLPAGKTPHGGVNISSPRGVTVCDVFQTGTKQIVCGTSRDARVVRHDESSASGMLASISGAVVALASCTDGGTALLAVADPFCGVRLGRLEPSKNGGGIKWRQHWYHSVEGKISAVEFVRDSSGRLRVAVGTKNGGVTVFHAQTGATVCRVATGPVAVVRIFGEPGGRIAVLSESGRVRRTAPLRLIR